MSYRARGLRVQRPCATAGVSAGSSVWTGSASAIGPAGGCRGRCVHRSQPFTPTTMSSPAKTTVRRSIAGILWSMNRESPPALRLDRILELAQRAALGPSDRILSGFRSPALAVEQKSDNSPVTAFDREAEQHIRQI